MFDLCLLIIALKNIYNIIYPASPSCFRTLLLRNDICSHVSLRYLTVMLCQNAFLLGYGMDRMEAMEAKQDVIMDDAFLLQLMGSQR